jgi:tetratricopeptide (TPR) repeat protein
MIALSRRALVVGAVGLVVVLALGVVGWRWYSAEQTRAASAYAEALLRVRLAAKPEDRTVVIHTLEATLARYPSATAAPQAAYQLAALRYDAGQHAAARSAYEIVLARGASGTLRTLAEAGIGYAWEAERDYAKAMDVYRGTLSRLGPKDFYYETLLMDLGRSQELAGRKPEAIETYRRLLKEIPQARRADEIRARLSALGAAGT